MRIRATKTKNTVQYAIIKDVNKNGKRTTCVYENIGNVEKLKKRAGNMEPMEWLNKYVKELNEQSKAEILPVIIQKNPNKIIEKNVQNCFNEVAENSTYSINQSIIDEEAKYDGLYAVCTNLEDTVEEIIEINHRCWEIEESFRIMYAFFIQLIISQCTISSEILYYPISFSASLIAFTVSVFYFLNFFYATNSPSICLNRLIILLKSNEFHKYHA